MAAYTAGYTALLFCASFSAALVVASRKLLPYAATITRCASAALFVAGIATAAYGFSLI
jgi:cytochrome c biogenesis protein CcdA